MIRRHRASSPFRVEVGERVPVPCRLCGAELIPFYVTEGITLLKCRRTGGILQVTVSRVEGVLEIRTRGLS